MQTAAKQFTRNADNFYLQVELHAQSLSFLLASTNQQEFYELRMSTPPAQVRHILPTINHFFFYLHKNYKHPKVFRIDPFARMHINVPNPFGRPGSVILTANRITRDSIMPEDFLIQEEPEVMEVKAPLRQLQPKTQGLAPFFGKKKKRDSETCYLDLEEETPRSQSVSMSVSEKEKIAQKNREACGKVEFLLRQGLQMGEVKKRLRLNDRTAWKMLQQFQKCGRILTPQQTILLRKNREVKNLLRGFKQENPKATAQTLGQLLQKKGFERSKEYIEEWLSCNFGHLIYYQESQSECRPCATE